MAKKNKEFILDPGETFELKGVTFEVLHASAQGEEGNLHHIQYEIGLHSDAVEKRAADEASAAEERKLAQKRAREEEAERQKLLAGNPELANKK